MTEVRTSGPASRPAGSASADVGTWLRRAVVSSAIVVGLVPRRWLHIHPDVRLVWAVEVLGFVACGLAAVLPRRTAAKPAITPWTGTWSAAVVLWLLAPLGGVWGLLLRLPVLQIAFLATRSGRERPPADSDGAP